MAARGTRTALAGSPFARAYPPDQEVNGYKFENQCYGRNVELTAKVLPAISKLSADQPSSGSAVRDLCATPREATPVAACAEIATRLASSRSTFADAWDAIHLSAAELRMRVGSGGEITGIHAVTSANALHHAYVTLSTAASRLLLLLQAAGGWRSFEPGRHRARRSCALSRSRNSNRAPSPRISRRFCRGRHLRWSA